MRRLCAGDADPLAPLAVQYADYAVWQRQWLSGEVLQQQAAYWQEQLAGAPALLELPTDHAAAGAAGLCRGARWRCGWMRQLTGALKALSRRHGLTLFMTLLAGWCGVLARLSGQDEVVIGTPVANRARAEIEGLIGFFVNTLALRIDLSGAPSVGGAAGAGEGGEPGGAGASGPAVRAGGGDRAAAAQPAPCAAVPGDVRLAERAAGRAGACRV